MGTGTIKSKQDYTCHSDVKYQVFQRFALAGGEFVTHTHTYSPPDKKKKTTLIQKTLCNISRTNPTYKAEMSINTPVRYQPK